MASLDDELALFESEISSLVTEPPKANGNGPAVTHAAPPQSQPVRPAPAAAPVPMIPRQFVPTQMSRVPPVAPMMLRPPVPPMMGMPFAPMQVLRPPVPPQMSGIFVPHQIRVAGHPGGPMPLHRAPPPPTQGSTIESGPSMYKAESASGASTSAVEVPKDMNGKLLPLPADVEAVQKKKLGTETSSKTTVIRKKKYVRTAGGQVWEDPSLSEWDPNDFRIFCGDLGNEVSDELLSKAFRKFPTFVKAKVIRDNRSNKSKGYGFVSFKSQEDYVRAIREMDGKYVGNRPIKLRKSAWKDRQLEVVKKKQKQKQKLGLMF